MENSEDHADLIDESIEPIAAIEEKLRRGRIKYGPDWVGKRAILEAHDEALDLGAYLLTEYDTIFSEIDEKLIEELLRETINIIRGIRTAISKIKTR
jgi:hypothetical protein